MKFIFNTNTRWDEPPRARHQLAKALSRKHRVIFIAANKIGKPEIKYNNTNKNLELIQPFFPVSYKIIIRLPILNEFYQNWLFSLIKCNNNFIVINFVVSATQIFKYFNKVIYYCNDNFIDILRARNYLISLYWKYTEKVVAKRSCCCIAVSDYLVEKLKKYNINTYRVLTGVSINQIESVCDLNREPMNIQKNIMFVGWLKKMDINWIIELAKNSNYNIYLVGPSKDISIKSLKNFPNIILTGPLHGEELHQLMMKADVFIAPYKYGKDTEVVYTMPNKFWLYIAGGKPIVTCRIKNLLKLPHGFVYQANNKSDFVKKVYQAYKEDSPELIKQRMKFINKNTWDKRVESLIKIIDNQ